MQAFLQTSSGEARDPASSVEQPAETFSSIAAVNRWLTVQAAGCDTPDLQKLRVAVSMLTKTSRPRQEDVSFLFSSWNVRQYVQRRRRPLARLIKELKQAVITEASRLRASLDSQTGATASSAAQPAALARAASSAEQPSVAGCTGKRSLDSVSAEQLDSPDSAADSVEQPAAPAPFETLADVWHWVEQLPETERRTDPICRVRRALRVLEIDTSRNARRQLQALLKSWDIKQKDPSNKKRSVVEVHQRLRAAVLKEGNRLRSMVSFRSRASFERLFRSSAAQRAAQRAAGQQAIQSVPVQGTDSWASSLCDEAGALSPNVLYSFVGTFRVASVAQPCSMPRRVV